jgi:hypothetical protein
MITVSKLKTAMHDEKTIDVEAWAEENLLNETLKYLNDLVGYGLQVGATPKSIALTLFQLGYVIGKEDGNGQTKV